MPHSIVPQPDGTFKKVPGNDPTILTNIIVSLGIVRGSWWGDPNFGLKNRGRLKNTASSEKLVQDDCQRALQWLLDSKRAKSIKVTTSRDLTADRHRMRIFVAAVQADGKRVTFETFVPVI
ncbi:phage GP46 family protein [Geomonas sp. Red32]|uniref:phage GP46 family protein n=1 Tax=Geomonas sp. Red32 TaxID=2912856 RepID=UPI00202CABDD|nr:phage GP46 family protein [Geomonas sp. Red32]MCM0081770.1 phage GP46 family protein [Geomonas sp. Red32]